MSSEYDIPAEFAGHLRIGTCSWKYDSWEGLVYEPGKRCHPEDYLPDYARHFTTVEIDQWFWSLFPRGVKLPGPDVVKRYAESVPDDFRFTIKAPNAITLTHSYAKQPKGSERTANEPNPHFLSVDLLNRFLEMLEPMHGKLGPIMFQFEYLNKQKMPSMAAFLERLHAFFEKAPAGFQYAIETRNPNYLKAEFLDSLRQTRRRVRAPGGVLHAADRGGGRRSSMSARRRSRSSACTAPTGPEIEEQTGGVVERDHRTQRRRAPGDGRHHPAEPGRRRGHLRQREQPLRGLHPLTIQRLLDILRARPQKVHT